MKQNYLWHCIHNILQHSSPHDSYVKGWQPSRQLYSLHNHIGVGGWVSLCEMSQVGVCQWLGRPLCCAGDCSVLYASRYCVWLPASRPVSPHCTGQRWWHAAVSAVLQAFVGFLHWIASQVRVLLLHCHNSQRDVWRSPPPAPCSVQHRPSSSASVTRLGFPRRGAENTGTAPKYSELLGDNVCHRRHAYIIIIFEW